MKKQTISKIRKYFILGGVFIVALVLYFVMSYSTMEKSHTVYSTMGEPKLPIVYVNQDGVLLNPMHAYIQDMGNKAARDCITVLPESRELQLSIDEYDSMVASAQYEIRSLDMGHLIENGTVKNIQRTDGVAAITLPIQNLIERDEEYLLNITLNTGERSLNFYTRILWPTQNHAVDMIKLAKDFTEKSFDKSAARNLAMYLESDDTGDNSTLSHVNLHSSFSQITWGSTGMQPSGKYSVVLKEYAGSMGEVQISYESYMTDQNGENAVFHNEDTYLMRDDPQRIFMMDFERDTNEIFDGNSWRFVGKKLELGITSSKEISTMVSPSQEFIAYTTDQMLLRYDQDRGGAISLFTYRSPIGDDNRDNYDAHDMKLLSVKNNGDVDFLVYGYINRGEHEGYNGIIYYTYDNSENTITENFFIPIAESYEKIKYDIDKLAYLSETDMLYLYYSGNVFGIDTNSFEVITVASGLQDSEFASSQEGRYIAYQDNSGEDIFHATKIITTDLLSDTTKEISESSSYVRLIGYIGDDVAIALSDRSLPDMYTDSYEIPASEIRIVGPDQAVITSYKKQDLLFSNISLSDLRIHFDEISRHEDGYVKEGDDTIVCNKKIENTTAATLATSNDKVKEKTLNIKIKDLGDKKTTTNGPRHYSLQNASSIDLNVMDSNESDLWFEAYAYGHLQGQTRTLREAYELVYDRNGYVVDSDQRIVWNRIDKKTIVNILKPVEKSTEFRSKISELTTMNRYDDFYMINADGIDLNSVLYYIGKGYPVVAYSGSSYNLIYAYDQYNIHLINPEDTSMQVLGKQDADAYYKSLGYHFIVALPKFGK